MDDVRIDKKYFDATFPLMDKFRELAPGSYKHCQNVSNMCESIASELGLNVEVLRCAALYHDVGKMNNPTYFSENQNGTNLHDDLDPFVSFQLISRHVGDSVLYLFQNGFPNEVIEVVSQHHGNTIVQAFFNKAKNGEPEDKFRYKCSAPSTTEALVLMLVDSIEATAKALFNNNPEDDFIGKALEGTIDRLMNDRQLDNMRIGTLNTTKKILLKELESIYHKRVVYDEDKTVGDVLDEKPAIKNDE